MPTNRTPLVLLLIFLALLIFYLWQRQSPAEPETLTVPTIAASALIFPEQSLFLLREVDLVRLEDDARVTVTHDGQGSFTLLAPSPAPADDLLLLQQLGALLSSGSRRTLDGDLAQFGLDAPTHQIVVHFEDATFSLAVGNLAPNQTDRYMLRNDQILLLPDRVIQPILNWLDTPPTSLTPSPNTPPND